MFLKKIRIYTIITVIAACFLLAVLPVSAVSITESPSAISRGGQVTISMNDLKDGSTFSILIDGEFNVNPGSDFNFETTSFDMPIALNNGQVSASTHGTTTNRFSFKQSGKATYMVEDESNANGDYSISESRSIPIGVISYIRLGGRARDDVNSIRSTIGLYGTKQGPENSQITFNIDGIDTGIIHLTVLVNGQAAMSAKTITVGGGLNPVTTTIVPTSTTTASTTTTTTGTGTTATTTTVTTTKTTATTVLAKTFYSADRKVSLATQGIDYAGLVPDKGTVVPADWLAVSDIYTIIPDTLVFSPAATLAFTVPKTSGSSYAYFVGKFENSQWTTVPSSAGTDTISARISKPGTYGLMAYRPESTLPASGTAATAGSTPAVQGTPRVASVAAAATTPAAATPAPWLPLSPFVVFGALAICCALVLRRE